MPDLVSVVQGAMLAWLKIIKRIPGTIILLLVALGIVSGIYASLYGKINSDLTTLIKPSPGLSWYRDNEIYKAEFPEFEQTAVIALSGADSAEVDINASRLRDSLVASGQFEFVFAPGVDPFIDSHKLYFLSQKDLKRWLQGIEYSYGSNLRLADSVGVVNGTYSLADHVSANRGLPLPEPLSSLVETINANADVGSHHLATLRTYPPLVDTSKDIYYQLIMVKGKQETDQNLPNAEIVANLHRIIGSIKVAGNTSIRLTGEIPLAHEEISAALKGIGIAGGISTILLFGILWFGIRSIRMIAAIFLMLTIGIFTTMAFSTLVIGSYNTLSLMFIVMFFGLGVDFAVHFVLRVKELAKQYALPEAIDIAMTDIGPALLLCLLTSAIAFLSFTPTAYRGLAELGIMSSAGMAIAFLLSVTLLPAIILRFGLGPNRNTIGQSISATLASRVISVFTRVTTSVSALGIVIGFAILTLFSAYLAKDMRFDYSVLSMRDAATEGMQTLLALQKDKVTTEYSISIIADDAQQARQLKTSLEALDVVGEVATPFDYVPAHQDEKHQLMSQMNSRYQDIDEVLPAGSSQGISDSLEYLSKRVEFLPAERQPAVAEYIRNLGTLESNSQRLAQLNSQMFDSFNTSLNDLKALLGAKPFQLADVPEDLKERLITSDGKYLLTVQPADSLNSRQATEAFILGVEKIAPNIAGRSVVEWGVGDVVVNAFQFAVALSTGCIFFLLIVYFRSLVLPVLVLIPIVLALLFTFAIGELTGLNLNMANILVVPLIIGLGVDTGIHVVHRSLHETDINAVFSSSTARAVLISAATTIGTFFSLSFSPHKGAASVGLLLTVAISLLVVITFVLLPALLKIFYRQPGSASVKA